MMMGHSTSPTGLRSIGGRYYRGKLLLHEDDKSAGTMLVGIAYTRYTSWMPPIGISISMHLRLTLPLCL